MTKIDEDISETLNLLCKSKTKKGYDSVYLFSNEKLDSVANSIGFENENLLTIAASGDQVLSAIYHDVSNVTIYDINLLTYYMAYLKIGAAKVLSYEEFCLLFLRRINGVLNPLFLSNHLLEKLKEVLPEDVYYYWKEIFFEIKKSGPGELFFMLNASKAVLNRNEMFKKEYYKKLQEKIRDKEFPKFINTSITEFSEDLHGQFSLVYLSNILDWVIESSAFELNTEELNEYILGILQNSVYPLLDAEGRVITYYDLQNNIYNIKPGLIGEKIQNNDQSFYVYTRKKVVDRV